MNKNTGECKVPGCDRVNRTRGLCAPHYAQARSGNRPELAAMLDPSRTGGTRKGKSNAGKGPEAGQGTPTPEPEPKAPAEGGAELTPCDVRDAQLAVLCEFATAVGIRHSEIPEGRLFVPDGRGQLCFRTEIGILCRAEVSVDSKPLADGFGR